MREDKMICEAVRRALAEDSIPELTATENEHVAICESCTDLLLTRLLQQKPEVAIPAEFASHVRSRVADGTTTARNHRVISAYGFTTAVAVLMVLALAWIVLAYIDPQWGMFRGSVPLLLEYAVTFEIGAIALWLGIQRFSG